MGRPRAKELTERELEIMQVFWDREGSLTASEVRDALGGSGRELAYTTVATLIRILLEKGFLQMTESIRPYRYSATRSYREVSGRLLGDLVQRVFGGSRQELLVRLLEDRRLTVEERAYLESILESSDSTESRPIERAEEDGSETSIDPERPEDAR